jgi:hypothetical protein
MELATLRDAHEDSYTIIRTIVVAPETIPLANRLTPMNERLP